MARTTSTAEVLARRLLQKTCGEECVDWAIDMLERGYDTRALRMLAGSSTPFHHFELARLRDQALKELGAEAYLQILREQSQAFVEKFASR